jgi:hypothetical protein
MARETQVSGSDHQCPQRGVGGGESSAGRAYEVYRVTYARCIAGSRPGEVKERSKRKEESDRDREVAFWMGSTETTGDFAG